MDLELFLSRRQGAWKRLEEDVARAERDGMEQLPVEDLRRIGVAYRQACSDLTYAKTVLENAEIADYLNTLVGQAYAAIYRKSRLSWKDALAWLAFGYPAAVRRHWRPVALSWFLLLAGFAFAFGATLHDRDAFLFIVPSDYHELYGNRQADLRQARFGNVSADEAASFSSRIYVNNIKVSLGAFAMGGTFGVGTVLMLFYNGALLGAIAANFQRWGQSWEFWSLIVPHGAVELSCIAVAGAAGLVLAAALIRPGRKRRGVAFAEAGRSAVPLALGTAPVLFAAGLLEGFVTPSASVTPELKMIVGIVTGALYWAWILLGGRGRRDGAPEPLEEGPPKRGGR